jgi:hypothetical protein
MDSETQKTHKSAADLQKTTPGTPWCNLKNMGLFAPNLLEGNNNAAFGTAKFQDGVRV